MPSPRLPAEHCRGAGDFRGPKSLTGLSLLLAEPKSQGPVPALCPALSAWGCCDRWALDMVTTRHALGYRTNWGLEGL